MACAPGADLKTVLKPTDVLSGWYDNGVNKEGLNHLLPSVTLRLKNESDRPVSGVDLMVSFWQVGADGESDSKQVLGIGTSPVPPGGMSDPITVRSTVGYTLEQPRAELFTHNLFKDFVAKLFAKRGGSMVAIGEITIERRLLPSLPRGSGRP